MAISYSTRLRLTLPGDGDLSGVWGQTQNLITGTLIEESIAGMASIAMPDANYTLIASNGATDEARRAILNVTGTLSATRNLIIPAVTKTYIVANNTAQSIVVKTSGGTGITVPTGRRMLLWCDGTDVHESVTYSGSLLESSGDSLTGALGLFSGTQSLPGLFWVGDPDTGFYWISANTFALINNANETIRFAPSLVTYTASAVFNANVTIGDSSADSLYVEATATFNNGVVLGSSSADALTVNATATFASNLTANGNVTLGDSSADALTVNATSTFAAPVTFNSTALFKGNLTIGDAASDTLTVVSTATFAENLTLSKALSVASNATVGGALTVAGTATFNGPVVLNGSFTLPADSVTNSELANMAAGTVKGRLSTLGDPQDLTMAQLMAQLSLSTILAGTQSLGTNGYVKLGDLYIQWGYYPGGSSGPAIPFPVTFPSACRAVILTPIGSTAGTSAGGGTTLLQLQALPSNASFSVFCSFEDGFSADVFVPSTTVPFMWFAVGH